MAIFLVAELVAIEGALALARGTAEAVGGGAENLRWGEYGCRGCFCYVGLFFKTNRTICATLNH